jgi:2-oxoglutarate dehydrogenase E2 component (dihydrolipoamide succinyltransferase)
MSPKSIASPLGLARTFGILSAGPQLHKGADLSMVKRRNPEENTGHMLDVILPQLGESVSEGTVTKWLVSEGDVVFKDQPLLEVATDKADSEIPAPAAGRVSRILCKVGEVVPVRAVLCQLEEGQFAPSAAPVATSSASAVPAGTTGIGLTASTAAKAPATAAVISAPMATPAARREAMESNVSLASVPSDAQGRIGREEVLRAAAASASVPMQSAQAAHAATQPAATRTAELAHMMNAGGGFVPPIPGTGFGSFKVPAYRPVEGDKVVPFTRRRRITADHMTYSKFASPHVVTVAEMDLAKVSKLREQHKDRYKKEGLGLTMLAFVIAATAKALRETPTINARVLADSFVMFKDVNIGVAVDSPEGLVVPVVRRADELGVRGIARSVDELAKRAKSGKITMDDLSGATFSVTNPGIKGNLFGGAIISQPNVGILRMGEIQKRVVVVESADGEDQMVIHPVMYMALSYDHRIVDGVAANSFLWRVTELLEKAEFEV